MAQASPTARVTTWLRAFTAALGSGDIAATAALFDTLCFWRDMVTFTWNITTLEGRDAITAMLEARLADVGPDAFRIAGEATEIDGACEAKFVFETRLARGQGYLRLRGERCWTLLTAITELKGHEEKRGSTRDNGVVHGVYKNRKTWLEKRLEEERELGHSKQPYCLIIGGGQGGMALGARLRRLDVPTIIIDKNPRAGDSWRNRYKSLCLHDAVWQDHMPYLPFPDHWPVFIPKDQMGDWLEAYARIMELNYWTSAACVSARYDDAAREWHVVVDRAGTRITLRPKQLVLATGMSGVPFIPSFPGAASFKGTQLHSSVYRSGEAYAGKRCVVIGSNNSAHDICADLWEHDADVTMVQRSPTVVVRSETLMVFFWEHVYSEAAVARGITTELADLMGASVPHRLTGPRAKPAYDKIREHDKDLYARLEKVGFQFDFGEDGSGIACKYARRGSGYYIDVGASELVCDGRIKLKSRVAVTRITDNSIVLSDGTELPADLIVYATGYGSMSGWAAQLISPEVAAKVGLCWGLGSGTSNDPGPWEGELRNMWKPTHQDALWFQGGNLVQARFFSIILALQLKARALGIPTPAYGMQQVHHRG